MVAISGNDAVGARLILPGMDGVACLSTSREVAIDGVVLAQKHFVQLTDEVLRQRYVFVAYGFHHHLNAHLTGFHIDKVLQVSFAARLAKQQEQLRLPVGQRVALDVVAVVVVLGRKLVTQQFHMLLR